MSRRSLRGAEVSQTGVLPHLVLCLPQMVGLGGSHVEDMTVIRSASSWQSDTNSAKGRATPCRNVRNTNGIDSRWYGSILSATWGSVWLLEMGHR